MNVTIDDLSKRISPSLLQDLDLDTFAHPAIEAALLSAEGEVLSALRASGRYSFTSFNEIKNQSIREFLKNLVCDIAIRNLCRYRLSGAKLSLMREVFDKTERLLEDIWKGRRILPLDEDATIPSSVYPSWSRRKQIVTLKDRLKQVYPDG